MFVVRKEGSGRTCRQVQKAAEKRQDADFVGFLPISKTRKKQQGSKGQSRCWCWRVFLFAGAQRCLFDSGLPEKKKMSGILPLRHSCLQHPVGRSKPHCPGSRRARTSCSCSYHMHAMMALHCSAGVHRRERPGILAAEVLGFEVAVVRSTRT